MNRSYYETRQGVVFDELDNRLGSIQRYNLFFTIQKQSVAAHIFNVHRIAMRIARDWFGITNVNDLLNISEWANHHEDLESLSGDILAMAKLYFDEDAFAEDNGVMNPRSPCEPERTVVKLADIMECTYFLYREHAYGNTYLRNHITWMEQRLTTFIERRCPEQMNNVKMWMAKSWEEIPDVIAPRGPSENKI